MRTYAEALAECMALGQRRADCEETLRDHFVAGAFCDGTIVMSADGVRCVSAATAERVRRVRAADPLVRPVASSAPFTSSDAGAIAMVALWIGGAYVIWRIFR